MSKVASSPADGEGGKVQRCKLSFIPFPRFCQVSGELHWQVNRSTEQTVLQMAIVSNILFLKIKQGYIVSSLKWKNT